MIKKFITDMRAELSAVEGKIFLPSFVYLKKELCRIERSGIEDYAAEWVWDAKLDRENRKVFKRAIARALEAVIKNKKHKEAL